MARIFRRRAGEAMREAGAPSDAVARNLVQISRLVAVLSQTFQSIKKGGPPSVDVITMRDVVDFLIAHRDQAEGAGAAAAVRQEHPDGLLLWLGFLDASGEPLEGGPSRTYLVKSLDPELEANFGGHPVVIFS